MKAIRDVEIFATGTHNGDTYTESDLDDMVAAFRQADYRPALKVGHVRDEPGAPAYGWVTNLRRVGSKLVADFEDMHDSVANAIRERRYSRVSAEVYHGLKRGGKLFRRALKAVALLGAEVPAVAGLVPLHKMQFAASTASHINGCAVPYKPSAAELARYADADDIEDDGDDGDDVGVEVDQRVRDYMSRTGEASYGEALAAVLAEDRVLARSYAAGIEDSGISRPGRFGPDVERVPSQAEAVIDRGEASARVHDLIVAWMEAHPGKDYSDGLTAILRAYPELAQQYRGINEAGPIWQPNQWEKDRR